MTDTVAARPVDLDSPTDVGAVLDLGRRHRARWSRGPADWTGEGYLEDLAGRPDVVPERDLMLVEAGHGPVAWVAVLGAPPYSEVILEVFVDPDLGTDLAGEVGRAAVGAADAAARSMVAGASARGGSGRHGLLRALALPGEPYVDVLRAEGFTYLRSTWTMRRSLAAVVERAPVPAGVSLRPIGPAADCEALAEVMQAAFAGHSGDWPLDAGSLRRQLALPAARPDLGLLARDDGGPVGGLLVAIEAGTGHVESVATLPRVRRRGLAAALLATAFEGLRDAGCADVRLHVDADNLGAVRLYERAGMARQDETQSWAREIRRTPPGGP